MVDICLELPDDLIRDFEERAAELGTTAEDLMRKALEGAAPRGRSSERMNDPLEDEPVLQAGEIEKEYRRLGYEFGWRFITCPQENAKTAKLLLVSLNPAGRGIHGPAWSQELGSAYRVESWGNYGVGAAPLQRQVQAMFSLLGLRDDQVFSAHYVPFRSPSWAELENRIAAEAFAKKLWTRLKPRLSFERIVCIGKDAPGQPIAALFDAVLEGSFPVGWGTITADRYRLPDGRKLIALPHLSRFGVFGRPAGEKCLRRLFEL